MHIKMKSVADCYILHLTNIIPAGFTQVPLSLQSDPWTLGEKQRLIPNAIDLHITQEAPVCQTCTRPCVLYHELSSNRFVWCSIEKRVKKQQTHTCLYINRRRRKYHHPVSLGIAMG